MEPLTDGVVALAAIRWIAQAAKREHATSNIVRPVAQPVVAQSETLLSLDEEHPEIRLVPRIDDQSDFIKDPVGSPGELKGEVAKEIPDPLRFPRRTLDSAPDS